MRTITALVLLLPVVLQACSSSTKKTNRPAATAAAADSCTLPVPAKWTSETFMLPVAFAPEIQYHGSEEVRFTPGWGKKNDVQYWSYAFLWTLEGSPAISSDSIAAYLTAYYNGLYRANTMGQPVNTRVSVTAAGSNWYDVRIDTRDYLSLQPLVLNAKISVKPGRGRLFIFHALSPQPYHHAVWEELKGLWTQFDCPG